MANVTLEKLETKIQKEQARLEAMYNRKEELIKDISKQEKLLENLRSEAKVQELKDLGSLASGMNISIAELMTAIKNGDFYGLQEKIESIAAANETAEQEQENKENDDSKLLDDLDSPIEGDFE